VLLYVIDMLCGILAVLVLAGGGTSFAFQYIPVSVLSLQLVLVQSINSRPKMFACFFWMAVPAILILFQCHLLSLYTKSHVPS